MTERISTSSPPTPPEFLGHASEFEPDEQPNILARLGLYTLVALLTVAACSNALGVGWIGDDQSILDTDMRLRSHVGLAYAWRHPLSGSTLPLGQTILNLQQQYFSSSRPALWHSATALSLLAAGLSLHLLLGRWRVPLAGWIVTILLIHPLATTSVVRLGSVTHLISFAAFAFAWIAFKRLSDPPALDLDTIAPTSVRWIYHPSLIFCGMLLAAAVALLSSPAIIFFAWVAVIVEATATERHISLKRRYQLCLAAFAVLASGISVGWFFNQPRMTFVGSFSAIAAAPGVAWLGILRTFVPSNIPFDGVGTSPASVLYWISLIGWLSLAVIAFGLRKRFGLMPIGFWIFATLAAVVATLGAVRCDDEWMIATNAELPIALLLLIAVAAAITAGVPRLAATVSSRITHGPLLRALGSLLVLGIATRSWFATAALSNEVDLLASAAQAHPASLAIACAYADALTRSTDTTAATSSFARAATVYHSTLLEHPTSRTARLGLANCLAKQQRYDEAIDQFRQAVAAEPEDASLYIGESQVYAAKGVGPQAMRLSRRALELDPASAVAHHDLGLQLDIAGQLDEAAIEYGHSMRLDPLFCPPRVNLATLWFRQGKIIEASEMLLSATRIDPMNFDAYANAGAMLATLEQWPRAEQMLRAALTLKHDAKDVWRNLAIVLEKEGKTREAHFASDRVAKLSR